MINGNYFRHKGLLVSWSLFREPKEKAESQGTLSPGRTRHLRGEELGWKALLSLRFEMHHNSISRSDLESFSWWLQRLIVTYTRGMLTSFSWLCALSIRGQGSESPSAGEQNVFKGWVTPFPAVLGHLTQSDAVFLPWFAALNWTWSLC